MVLYSNKKGSAIVYDIKLTTIEEFLLELYTLLKKMVLQQVFSKENGSRENHEYSKNPLHESVLQIDGKLARMCCRWFQLEPF